MKAVNVITLCILLLSVLVMSACTIQQAQVAEAQAVVSVPDKVNFFERRQVAAAEELNDRPGKVYWWYLLGNDGRLIASYTCIGRPVSSTESLEPNNMSPYISTDSGGFQVPLQDGVTAYTREAMGLDGTFGEPVPFRYCITPEGHYVDVSMFMNTIVSTIPLTFPEPEVRFDQDLEAKKLIAEQTLEAGGCIDSYLNPIDCAIVDENTK